MDHNTRQLTVDSTLVDADRFLTITERLREAHARLDDSRVPVERRPRWQRRLVAISEIAHHDLDRAEEKLRRYEDDFERHLRRR